MLRTATIQNTIARIFGMSTRNEGSDPHVTVAVVDEIDRVFPLFAKQYGEWAGSLFDEHFLHGRGYRYLAAYMDGTLSRSDAAKALGAAWEAQMGPARPHIRKRRRADAVMAADDFLAMVTVSGRPTTAHDVGMQSD